MITSQRSIDLLHVAQDLLSQQMNQPGDNLRIPPLDGVQGSFRQLGQLRVPDSVDCGGSVHVGQSLNLDDPQNRGCIALKSFPEQNVLVLKLVFLKRKKCCLSKYVSLFSYFSNSFFKLSMEATFLITHHTN